MLGVDPLARLGWHELCSNSKHAAQKGGNRGAVGRFTEEAYPYCELLFIPRIGK